jgi:Mlc titration factor MtfA (ptsG expression regulator)
MRWFRRAQPAPVSFPDEWRGIVERRFGEWLDLSLEERARLEYLTALLVDRFGWEAARDFDLTDDIVVTIAVHAAYVILGLDDEWTYDNVGAVIVHPRPITLHGERTRRAGATSCTTSSRTRSTWPTASSTARRRSRPMN